MNDMIYRQEAIEAACRGCSGDFYQECQAYHGRKTFCDQIKRLRAVPSAQGYADTDYMEKMSDLIFDSAFEMGKASAQRWIPVTEGLPKEDGRYLTTNGQGWYEVASYAHRYSDIDAMYELPQDGGGWYIYDSEWGYCVYSSVVAWMPIEPWKGERDD